MIEPPASLRVKVREYIGRFVLPGQAYSCSLCLGPLGEGFTVRLNADDISRSDAVCQCCAAELAVPAFAFQLGAGTNVPARKPRSVP